MNQDSKNDYGAFELLDELEDALRQSGKLLEQTFDNLSYRLLRLQPLLFSINENLKAIFSLRKVQLPQESFLIGNVILHRAVSFCYLLSVEQASFEKLTNSETIAQNVSRSIEAFLSFDLTSLNEQAHGYMSPGVKVDEVSFKEKLDALYERAEIGIAAFQIANASFSSIATEMMNGSYWGCISRLAYVNFSKYETPTQANNRYLRGEFTILYFVLCLVLSQPLKAIAKEVNSDELSKESQAIVNRAAQLVANMKTGERDRENLTPAGLWESLFSVEATAVSLLSEKFRTHENAIRKCYELGVQAPSLPSDKHSEVDMQIAGLFLKRTLSDLRTVWLLTSAGYTSQAASIAASLFEHALTVVYVAGNLEKAKKLISTEAGDSPWSVRELSQNLAKHYTDFVTGKAVSEDDLYDMTGIIYGGYKYLCKIKHPTLRSTRHESGSSSLELGKYAIMAIPDLRKEDDSLKSFIVNISVIRCFDAIKYFAKALNPAETTSMYLDFSERLRSASEDSKKALETLLNGSPLPFGIGEEAIKWKSNRPSQRKKKTEKR